MMLAGIVLFAACKNHNPADISNIDSVEKVLVKTASINFKVKNVQQCTEKVGALASRLGGMVMHHDITSIPGNTKDIKLNDDSIMRVTSYEAHGEMTVQIPSERMAAFTDSVGKLGLYVKESHLDIQDKSLEYLSAEMKLDNHDELIKARKQDKAKSTAETATALSHMKDSLVNERIINLKIQRDAEYSTINLSFFQSATILKEVLPNDNLSAYNLPFFKRLGAAFAFGWSLFTESVLLLANLWVLLIIIAVVFIVARKYQIKRRTAANPSV